MNNYLKIGIAVSLAAHVGFFALGGWAMDKLVQMPKDKMQQTPTEDITYADVQPQTDSSDAADEVYSDDGGQAEPESEINIAKDHIQQPVPESSSVQNNTADEQASNDAQSDKKADGKNKKQLRRLGDIKDVKIAPIGQVKLNINNTQIQDSKDLMPTYQKRVQPEYDHDLIPEGEEIPVVLEFLLDDNGKVTQVYFIKKAEDAGVLQPDAAEDIDAAAVLSLEKWEIIPAKNEQGRRTPQQQILFFTHDGVRFGMGNQ